MCTMKLTRMLRTACLSWLLGRAIALMLWPSSARFACDHARALVLAPFLCRHSAWLLGAGERLLSGSCAKYLGTKSRRSSEQPSNGVSFARLAGQDAELTAVPRCRPVRDAAWRFRGFGRSACDVSGDHSLVLCLCIALLGVCTLACSQTRVCRNKTLKTTTATVHVVAPFQAMVVSQPAWCDGCMPSADQGPSSVPAVAASS